MTGYLDFRRSIMCLECIEEELALCRYTCKCYALRNASIRVIIKKWSNPERQNEKK